MRDAVRSAASMLPLSDSTPASAVSTSSKLAGSRPAISAADRGDLTGVAGGRRHRDERAIERVEAGVEVGDHLVRDVDGVDEQRRGVLADHQAPLEVAIEVAEELPHHRGHDDGDDHTEDGDRLHDRAGSSVDHERRRFEQHVDMVDLVDVVVGGPDVGTGLGIGHDPPFDPSCRVRPAMARTP